MGGAALAQTANLDTSRALANDLLADASGRTSQLAAADTKFTVDVHGYMQFRYNWNHRDDESLSDGEDNAVGFQNARTRLNVSGNIFNEDWYYFVQFGWGPDGDTLLEDAYGSYKFGNGWDVMWGQFKAPFMREELVSDKFQLAADRSQLWNTFSLMRTQGIQLGFEGQQARVMLSFNDGAGASNTDFTSATEADWAATARVEFKWAGDWKQALDFTSFPQSPFFGMVGVAGHWQSGGDTFATTDVDVGAITADVSLEGDGWNAFAAAVYRHVDPATSDELNDWGFLAQGGIFVGPKWELFARWDIVIPDDSRTGGDDTFSALTFGVNNYMMQDSHAAKLTIDFQWFMDNPSQSIVSPNTLTGLLPSDEDTQWNLRAQMQLVF